MVLMPRKKNVQDSKSAETCSCGCCRWHSSRALKALLGVLFVLMIGAIAASLIYSSSAAFYSNLVLSFIAVVLLIVFIGWVFGFFCSCRGQHWSRHGFNQFDEAKMTLRNRYAKGDITKKEYDKMMKDIE